MNTDPWLDAINAAPAPDGAAPAPTAPPTCWRCEREPAATDCRICRRPLCADCRIDHYHEGWER